MKIRNLFIATLSVLAVLTAFYIISKNVSVEAAPAILNANECTADNVCEVRSLRVTDLTSNGSINNGTITLGDVTRNNWPYVFVLAKQCTFNAGSGAGWKNCLCDAPQIPSQSVMVTGGWAGDGCESVNGHSECSRTRSYGELGMQFWHDGTLRATVYTYCMYTG